MIAQIAQNLLPQLPLVVVFAGMFTLVWRSLTIAHDLSKLALQGPAPKPVQQLTPAPAPVPAVVIPPAPTQIAPVPKAPVGDPSWLKAALHEIGFHETGTNHGIDRYIAMAHCGADGDPWCAIFANAMLEQAGIPGTRSAASQSFLNNPNFVPLARPARGALVVFWRIQKNSGQGHIGFYWGEDDSHIWTLGGNENDMVQIEALPKDGASFGLIGYVWPKSVPLPTTGPVVMPPGSAISVQTAPSGSPASAQPGVLTNITATVFGGAKSAYGGPIDDTKPGVALPARFEGARPQVQVTNHITGKSVVCDIVDVGPWNTHDPYWQNYGRPQAESGVDFTGRKTNGAGIDLTLAAANAIQIDGKGRVDWAFVNSPASPIPNVS